MHARRRNMAGRAQKKDKKHTRNISTQTDFPRLSAWRLGLARCSQGQHLKALTAQVSITGLLSVVLSPSVRLSSIMPPVFLYILILDQGLLPSSISSGMHVFMSDSQCGACHTACQQEYLDWFPGYVRWYYNHSHAIVI